MFLNFSIILFQNEIKEGTTRKDEDLCSCVSGKSLVRTSIQFLELVFQNYEFIGNQKQADILQLCKPFDSILLN